MTCGIVAVFATGSAMRVSPVVWTFDDLKDVEFFVGLSAGVTHNHPDWMKYDLIMRFV